MNNKELYIENELQLKEKAVEELNRFLDITFEKVSEIDPSILKFMGNKARIGLQIFKEVNTMQRVTEHNVIRIYKEIALDREQFAEFIKNSLPKFYPLPKE